MEITKDIKHKLDLLKEKYDTMGQSMDAYLDGLLISNYVTYWDYVQVDTLLSIQQPKTDFPDEIIFIMYHQITELYFKLSLHEMEQIANNGKIILENGEDKGWNEKISGKFLKERVNRINRYFEALTKSFEIMVNGMEKEQFLRFRMALLPASGFQSAQYRMIEIYATDFINLVDKDEREKINSEKQEVEKMFQHIYWNKGAKEVESGKKTLTLKQFEKKYSDKFIHLAKSVIEKNIWAKYRSLSEAERKDQELIDALRMLDVNVNINWPLVHYKSAVRYLAQENSDIPATGGTNWQKYLPPRFQKRIFYPELWTEEEKNEWGKKWVESVSSR